MSNATINGSNRIHRKTLSTQIDRLDGILDGLSEALSESVAMAVKEAVSGVVREAVEAAVKEVLSNPQLLKAALAQHTPLTEQVQPATPKTKPQSLWESLKTGWIWLREQAIEKAGQAKRGLSVAWTWCLEKLGQGGRWMSARWSDLTTYSLSLWTAVGGILKELWVFRRTCSFALCVGVVSGVASYLAGPFICAVLCGLGSAALSVAGMILLPLWHMLAADANEA